MEKGKNNNGIVVFLVMLVVVLIIICGLFWMGIIDVNKKDVKVEDNKTETSIKIDGSKDYVYDANYTYTNKYKEFSRGNGMETETVNEGGITVVKNAKEYLKDLKVPYINIKSEGATKANSELEKLYIEEAKLFDECAADVINNKDLGVGCSQVLTYKTYKYNDILSVVVIKGVQSTSPMNFEYKIYNFNLKDGSLITYNDMLSKLNLSKEETFNKFKSLIKTKMDSEYQDLGEKLEKACNPVLDDNNKPLYNTKDCYEISYKLLQEEIDNNKVLFFVDNAGNLNVLSVLYYDGIQNGDTRRYLIKIK